MDKDNRMGMLLAGIGIGAATAFLVARHASPEFRKTVDKSAGEAKDFLKSQASTFADRVGTAAEAGQEKFATQLAHGKSAARDLGDKVKDAVDNAVGAASKAADDVRKRLEYQG